MKNKRSKICSILILFLSFSVCVNIALLWFLYHKNTPTNLTGTYISRGTTSEESRYLVFEKDGTYLFYEQFHILSSGTYTTEQDTVYRLKEKSAQNQYYVVYDGHDIAYLFSARNGIQLFQRSSDLPTYVNISKEKL